MVERWRVPGATRVLRALLALGGVLVVTGLAAPWPATAAGGVDAAAVTVADLSPHVAPAPTGGSSRPELGHDAPPPRATGLPLIVGAMLATPSTVPTGGARPVVGDDPSRDIRPRGLREVSTRAGPT